MALVVRAYDRQVLAALRSLSERSASPYVYRWRIADRLTAQHALDPADPVGRTDGLSAALRRLKEQGLVESYGTGGGWRPTR